MKKLIALLLIMIVCLCGCSNQRLQDVMTIEESGIESVSVTSLPESNDYLFTEDNAKELVDYLMNLKLQGEFGQKDNPYNGMIWVITLEYENEDVVTVYLSDKIIRTEDGPWYQISYKEVSHFESLLDELESKLSS